MTILIDYSLLFSSEMFFMMSKLENELISSVTCCLATSLSFLNWQPQRAGFSKIPLLMLSLYINIHYKVNVYVFLQNFHYLSGFVFLNVGKTWGGKNALSG